MRRLARLAFVPLFGLAAIAACSSSDDDESAARASLASGCNINSDCTEPLVCAFRKCHTACEVTRDCPAGQRCMASDKPFHICQLPDEQRCSYNSQCPQGQACGVDGECRDQCSADRDCVRGQRCVTGTCAEPSELDGDGRLSIESDANPELSGQPCSLSSDCTPPFVCRSGLCNFECLGDRDCDDGQSCNGDHRCQARLCGGFDPGVRGGQTCSFDSQCEAPLVCHAGRCDCRCISASDCEPGQACVGFQCVSEAVSDGGVDAAIEASVSPDAGTGADGAADASVDANEPPDAGPAAPDAGADAATDANVDASELPDAGSGEIDAGTDAAVEVYAKPATSCLTAGGEGLDDCGGSGAGTESCCTTLLVTGGDFYRDYDGATATNQSYPASVSDFQLDKYEVTVGRFRQFFGAWLGKAWRPDEGDGKHEHLNGGVGLRDGDPSRDVFEPGWNPSWNDLFPDNAIAWDNDLMCNTAVRTTQSWTSTATSNERLPMNCVSWYEAYAFCIWDGGFLPSEAEWNYAAAGGDEQRVYPWSDPADDQTLDCDHASYNGGTCAPPDGAPSEVGSKSPLGDGRFGQADLAGNLSEWVSDTQFNLYMNPCEDCAYHLDSTPEYATGWIRGGNYTSTKVTSSTRIQVKQSSRSNSTGFRCARVPKNAP